VPGPDALFVRYAVTNKDTKPWDFTLALHSYYATSHVSKSTVEGPFSGATYVDKTQTPPVEAPATANSIPVDKFLEGVFPNLAGPVSLVDAGRKVRWPSFMSPFPVN
jgi:D-hexose-6-phosphate mutarotase